jgi:hypothetical protein
MRKLRPVLLLMIVTFLSVSCDKEDDEPSNIVNFNNSLSGSQEVPAVTTSATGNFTGSYDKTTNVLTYTVSFSGLTPSGMHFHKGVGGASGAVESAISTTTSPYSSTVNLTESQEADLLGSLWYINIHTSANAGGEIRAQLIPAQ